QTDGLSDSALYYRMVAGEPVEAREMRFRVLVPYLARPIRALTGKLFSPPKSVYLALLVANSIFCATTACLIVLIGFQLAPETPTGLLAALLYLLNFAVMNLFLPAMIDAGEAFALLAVTLVLLGRRWWLLPIWGIVGTLAKETFVPLAVVLTLTWWFVAHGKGTDRWRKLYPVLVMTVAMVATAFALRLVLASSIEPAGILEATHASGNALSGRFSVFFSPTVWYVFIWLLPLGATRLNRLPRPWVIASIVTAMVVLALGIFRDIGGNGARPLFSVLGPMLSLSAAIWLSDSSGPPKLETNPPR